MRIEADIVELAPGGDGVAVVEIDGERRAIFARATCPGDRVIVEVDASRRPARGRVVELVTKGEARVTPACAHVDRCGGCDWMHVALDAQAAAHESIVQSALPKEWRDRPIVRHGARRAIGYRARARVHARVSGGRAIVGMNEASSREPQEVDTCVVLDPTLDRARANVAALLEGAHGRGDAQIALGAFEPAPQRPVLELVWGGALPADVYARIERAVLLGDWAGARVFAGEVTRPAVIGDPTPWMLGADGKPLRLAPGGFAQASEAENARLGKRVAELADETRARKVLELYAGAGNLSVLLAKDARDLVTVESLRAACEAARANLTARGLRARVIEADADEHAIGPTIDLVVLDPPRKGARRACAAIFDRAPKHVLYVSCDAQTLGRDLAALAPKYVPLAIETFEMFPGTSHVETVVFLQKRRP